MSSKLPNHFEIINDSNNNHNNNNTSNIRLYPQSGCDDLYVDTKENKVVSTYYYPTLLFDG
jgi:hypothetical protein